MKEQFNDPLLLAGKVLTVIIQAILALAGVVLAIMIPVVVFFKDQINAELAADHAEMISAFPVLPIAGLFAILIVVVALGFLFLGKLRAIINTVGERDPFVPENADRLSAMAWLALGVQALMVPIGILAMFVAEWASEIENAEFNVDAGFDLTGILMVVVLFILARVFKNGAAMREDLEGTV